MAGEPVNVMGPAWTYPEVLFRPQLLGDDRVPKFSSCTVPFVYYIAHEDSIWHALTAILPQVMGFLLEGQANRDVTYVVRSPTRSSLTEMKSNRG